MFLFERPKGTVAGSLLRPSFVLLQMQMMESRGLERERYHGVSDAFKLKLASVQAFFFPWLDTCILNDKPWVEGKPPEFSICSAILRGAGDNSHLPDGGDEEEEDDLVEKNSTHWSARSLSQ